MKYISLLFLFVSFTSLAEGNLSYRFKLTALQSDTELKYQSKDNLYIGDFLLSNSNNQSQKLMLDESLSILELGTSYNWNYFILSADYGVNIAGDKGQKTKPTLLERPINDPIFYDDDLTFNTSSLIKDVDYQSGQVSIGIGNGSINVFGGYKFDTKVTTMDVSSYINYLTQTEMNSGVVVLDSVFKGPFAGVSLLYDVTENSYIAVKLALTQYESGHLMLSNDNVQFNEPLTGKALSFSTKWTGRRFFIGFQSKYYKSDSNEQVSLERTELGLDIGIYFL